jgi:hypothetical protein
MIVFQLGSASSCTLRDRLPTVYIGSHWSTVWNGGITLPTEPRFQAKSVQIFWRYPITSQLCEIRTNPKKSPRMDNDRKKRDTNHTNIFQFPDQPEIMAFGTKRLGLGGLVWISQLPHSGRVSVNISTTSTVFHLEWFYALWGVDLSCRSLSYAG